MNEFVLDSSAVLALIFLEPGKERVEEILDDSIISAHTRNVPRDSENSNLETRAQKSGSTDQPQGKPNNQERLSRTAN